MTREPPSSWERQADVVVVGSGTGLVGALKASTLGASVLVLEKAPVFGGSTAISSGGTWIPTCSHVQESLPPEKADRDVISRYLRRIVGDRVPDELLDQFLETGDEAVSFIEEASDLEFLFHTYPDYYPEWEGGSVRGHGIKPDLYDATGIADRLDELRDAPFTPPPFTSEELADVSCYARLPVEIDQAVLEERAADNILSHGRGLIAGLFEACLRSGVDFERDAPATELVVDGDAVVGIVAEIDGQETHIGCDAVLLAAGGMEWDPEMCDNFLRGPMTAPASPPYNEGDAITMACEMGVQLGNMQEAWWYPMAKLPGEEWEDGSPMYRLLFAERAVPGTIIVNQSGERFMNEAGPYNDITKTFHEFDPEAYEYRNLPAFQIFDEGYRERYAFLNLLPDDPDPEWLTSADSLDELATMIGISQRGLVETIERFNDNASAGEDPEYHRGESAHDEFFGDSSRDSPNLGPINDPPYYAMEVLPGCLGTKGGIVTTPSAQAVDVRGRPIAGLYASANSTAHVMGIGYAGGGGTLGPNIVFSYLAGKSAGKAAISG